MISVDSSVLIAWINKQDYPEVERFEDLMRGRQACIAPVTVAEILSSVAAGPAEAELISVLPQLPTMPGFWERAGILRAKARKAGRRTALADALIAQASIDVGAPLLTRDTDFAIYAEFGGLELA